MYHRLTKHRFPTPARSTFTGRSTRPGLSLAELLIASAIMAIVMGALAAMATTVQVGFRVGANRQDIAQHGRVALQRIERRLSEAWASSQFPGFIVVSEPFGGASFPEALAVWSPSSSAADPDGLPLASELVVFCPDTNNPQQLLEITFPTNTSTVPAITDTSAWRALVDDFQTNASAARIVLTDHLRTAILSDGGTSSTRGCVRFAVLRRPSDTEMADYQAGTLSWENLLWPMDMYSTESGTRQSWCQIELQLVSANANNQQEAIPFFGSATCHFAVTP